MTINDIISGNTIIETRILDWFDRELCSICRLSNDSFVVHGIVSWNLKDRCGIRIVVPITLRLFEEVSNLDEHWNDSIERLNAFLKSFEDVFVAGIEMANGQIENWKVTNWLPGVERGVFGKHEMIMAGMHFFDWRDLIMVG